MVATHRRALTTALSLLLGQPVSVHGPATSRFCTGLCWIGRRIVDPDASDSAARGRRWRAVECSGIAWRAGNRRWSSCLARVRRSVSVLSRNGRSPTADNSYKVDEESAADTIETDWNPCPAKSTRRGIPAGVDPVRWTDMAGRSVNSLSCEKYPYRVSSRSGRSFRSA